MSKPNLFFSFVIPVFNRPDELCELLSSLTEQTYKNFEVVVVDDGSDPKLQNVVEDFPQILNVKYFFKENSGPGLSRNYGVDKSSGEYVIFLDSDCIAPANYLETVVAELEKNPLDAFGGPDMDHPNFSVVQRAISYSMTSFFTTGGIRGRKKQMDKFYPRSFNMGIRTEKFKQVKGFAKMRFGEDIDLSIRMFRAKFKIALIHGAYVFHKRRNTLKSFYKQVFNSGIARINLTKLYPDTLKIVYLLPGLFALFTILNLVFLAAYFPYSLIPAALFALLIFSDALRSTKNLSVAAMAIGASFVQLFGYGTGFLYAFVKRFLFRRKEFYSFDKTFYN